MDDAGIFGHRKIGAERQFLENGADAARLRRRRRPASGDLFIADP
jgi:hypothetical protein